MKKITFFIFFLILFFVFSKFSFASVYFEDNFDDGNANGWQVEHFTPPDPNHPNWQESIWTVNSDKQYGIRLPYGDMRTFSTNGSLSWTDYIYYVQLIGKEGIDKNIIFRYQNKNNWYGFHMVPDGVHLGMMINGSYSFDTRVSNFFFTNDKIYNLKIKISGGLVSFYENNNPIVENYPVWNNPLSSGKIGLYASTGANYPTSVWFDNVMVCSLDEPCETPSPTLTQIPPSPTPLPQTPTPLPPIVFLPGLGGSINFKEMFLEIPDPSGWRMTPGANVYKNLLKAFEGNPNFYVFYYDWRKSILDSAQKLNDYIQNIVKPWNNKVYLVGHSLGGLVGRACVQRTANNCFAEKLITVSSPHLGVVDAYPLIEAGEIWRKGIAKLALEILIHYYQKPGETKRETIERVAPVIKEFLPNFDYLYKNVSPIPFGNLSIQNPLLPQLADISFVKDITKTITGNSFSTLRGLNVTDPNWLDNILGNWPDGKPIDKIYSNEGDQTVLLLSSKMGDLPVNNFTFDLDHGGIISDKNALTKIFELLDFSFDTNSFSALNNSENYLVFFVHSAVKISLEENPPDTYATDEIVIVPNPEDKIYHLNVVGLKDDFYTLSVGQILGNSVIWNEYFNKIDLGTTQNFQFSIDTQNPKTDPILDLNGEIIKKMLRTTISEFRNEIAHLKIKSDKSFLFKQLNDIHQGIKNPQSAFSALFMLRQNVAEYEKNKTINNDTANLFRSKAKLIANFLETIFFTTGGTSTIQEAQLLIDEVKDIVNTIESEAKLSRNGGLVYLEAQEKLQNAEEYFNDEKYFQAKIYAMEAKDLFQESTLIK